MALLPWDDEEDKKKDELYGTPVKAVTSVQSGAWQPAPSGADAPAMGDGTELAQNGAVDQQPASQGNYLLSEEKAQADEAKRQRDAQIAEARRQAAAQQAAQAMQVTEQTQEQPQPKSQKYTPVKGEGGVKGFLKGVGASIQQGLATVADVGIQAAAIPGGLVKDGKDLVNYMAEVEKVRANLHNKKDITGNKFTGTQDVEQQALNIVNGKASIRDVASVTGKGMQVGLDSTMFLNPARGALLGAKGLQKSLSPIVRYAARDAAFFGSLQGTATFQRVYGETGDIEAAIVAAAKDAAIGGALQGTLDVAGQGIGVGANRTINSLRRNKQFDELGTEIANVAEEAGAAPTISQELSPAQQDGNINFQPDTPQFTPVADGVPTQLSPDGLQPVRESTLTAADQTPMGRPVGDQIPNQVTPATNVPAIDIQPARPAPVADGVAQQADVVPAIDPNAPTVKSEQLKLQESRAGTSQAEEAVINQELQRINPDTPAVKTRKIHPEDQAAMSDFIDYQRGIYKPDAREAQALELEASRIAEHYGLDMPNTAKKLADVFDQRLMQDGFGKKPRELSGAAQQASLAREAAPVNNSRLPRVDAENTRLFGDKAQPVEYTDGIKTEGGDRAVGVTQDGAGESGIIIDRNAENAEAVFHHEAVHKTLNDYTTPEQRANVVDSYRKHHGIDDNMSNDQVEELLSDDFTKFVAAKNSKDAARAEMDLPDKVKDFFEQAWQTIKETYASMKANGTLTPEFEKLYRDLNDGKFVNKSAIAKAADPRNRYMVAGKGAKNFDPEDKAGRNFTGIEGLTRFEIDDSAARITDNFIETVKNAQKSGRGGAKTKLGDVVSHDKLFEAYPDLKDIDVSLFYNSPSGGMIKYGGYAHGTNSLRINAHPRTAAELRATILHEVQHAIQQKEGFARGLTPTQSRQLGRSQPAGNDYFRSAEEIESRLVETRSNMSQSERDAKPFYDSVPADKPIGKTLVGMEDYSSLPQVHTGTRIAKEMAAAGTKPKPNKNPVREPFENSVPDSFSPVTPGEPGKPIRAVRAPQPYKPKKTITPEQKAQNDFANRVFSDTDLHKDFRKRLARALGIEKDSELPIEEMLANSNLSEREKAHIAKKFGELEEAANEYNALMKAQRKGYKKSKTAGLDEEASRQANTLIDRYGRIERDLNSRVRRIQGRKSFANRAANVAENLTGARNANILTSVGGIERNLTQELGVNILETIMHPVRMMRNSVKAPAEIIRAYKRAGREFTNAPKTISEAFPYLLGNTYRLIMSPVTGVANVRKSVARETLAESLLRAQGETPTRAEIKRFAGAMGADSEVVANSMMGILNGMTSHGKGLEVMRAYQEFIKTGSPAAKERFLANTERAANLAAKMTQVAAESDKPGIRMGVALMNTVFPFVNTATNLARTAVTYNLNPLARSITDETLKAVRSNPENVMAILKAKGVNYGVLVGVYALYESGVIGYNDGEDVSKPKGVYIDRGDNKFFPVRGTPIELPIAAVVTAAEIAKDVAEGNAKPPAYYAGIMGKSLPYVDSTNNLIAATGSAIESYAKGDVDAGTGDNGYAVKDYGVNLAKSYVPWSNNGVIPANNAIQGKSTNAKSVYDKDMKTWLKNSVRSSYDPAFRESLPDSRDMAGRVRTVDQQGGFTINKTINDANTATFNEPIMDLVEYGRDNGLGKGTQDMFNTYDTGKNNNFKSVQDAITFLDAPEVDGKTKPDNAKKLEKNAKYTDLSNQIREGFYGETSDELLTLDGKNLYSDVSMPNADGTKNSRKPINMQSIKNAIAQTDLPEAERNRMYEISQANQALYAKVESKEMTYAQYKAIKAESEKEYVTILSNSKNYKKMVGLFDHLDNTGFFKKDGLGSTRSGQTYLWNSLNALLGSKGATPAADYPKDDKGYKGYGSGRGGGGSGRTATTKAGINGIQWTPAGKRQMASVPKGKYTPFKVGVKLGNEVKKDRSQNYSDRSF